MSTQFNSVSQMKLATLKIGSTCETLGYTTPNDGGGAQYLIVASGTGTDDGGSYHDLDGGQQAELIVGARVDVKQFGADGTGAADSLAALDAAVAYAVASRQVLTASKGDSFKISDQLDLTGVAADCNFATIKPDFDGKAAVVFGNDADLSNLDISPTTAFENDAIGLGAAAPVDFVSHGFQVTGRPILTNLAARNFKGHGFDFVPVNGNNGVYNNMVSEGNNRGYNLQTNAGDNFSICSGTLYAYGNSGPGFHSGTSSNFRHNEFFIKSEFNNHDLTVVFGGFVIDCFFGNATRNQLNVYSEGQGGVIDYNIYVDEATSLYNTVNSFRQDLDHLAGSSTTYSGSRIWQQDSDGTVPIAQFEIANSNINTFPMVVEFIRGAGTYGKLVGSGGALYLTNDAEEKWLGVDQDAAIVGNERIIAGFTTLTNAGGGAETAQIKIDDLVADDLMTGTIYVRAISGGNGGRKQYRKSFNSYNGTVTFGLVDNINSDDPSDYSTFTVSQTGTEVFLDLTYDTGNLGALYDVKWQVNFSTV